MIKCYCDGTAMIGTMHCHCDGTAVIGMTHSVHKFRVTLHMFVEQRIFKLEMSIC